MRKVLSLLSAILLASCSPHIYTLQVEQRVASLSGLDLTGKSISVTYMEDGFGRDSVFAAGMANAFASELEADYFDGRQVIGLYRMQKDMGRDYSEKDTLVNLVMDTGGDVVFLFDTPEFGNMSVSGRRYYNSDSSRVVVSLPCSLAMYVYDSMDRRDTVRVFHGKTEVSQAVTLPRSLSQEEQYDYLWYHLDAAGEATGQKAAGRFLSNWTRGHFSLYYYEVSEVWSTAIDLAADFRWQEAMDIWLQLVTKKNSTQRMCAAYNLAVACFVLGHYSLAEQWLEISDKEGPAGLSDGLHKRINKVTAL